MNSILIYVRTQLKFANNFDYIYSTIKKTDYLFPSNEPAFAKNLRQVSRELFDGITLNPKTLRKIGVGIFEQLGYNRSDVERVGGWSANSPILAHYFKRKGVSVPNSKQDEINRKLNPNIYEDLELLKNDNQKLTLMVEKLTELFKEQKYVLD